MRNTPVIVKNRDKKHFKIIYLEIKGWEYTFLNILNREYK